MKAWRYFSPVLVLFAIAAAPGAPLGYIDLPKLVAASPLYAVLAQYDREIAALRSTQSMPELRNPAGAATNAAQAQRRQATQVRTVVNALGSDDVGNRERERTALAALGAAHGDAANAMTNYTDALLRETQSSLAAFERATAQRTARAYAARAQQLREKESTLAFDLEKQDANKRLSLRLKLEALHLTAARRASLQAELAALSLREFQTVAAARQADAATLATYGQHLESAAAQADTQMAAQLRTKAAANYALRRHVAQMQSIASSKATLSSARVAAFSSSYARAADADAVANGIRDASEDLSRRYAALAQADARSQRETKAELATLQADRAALYRSIVGQILRTAQRLAHDRHLGGIVVNGAHPPKSRDLTSAVAAALTR